MNDFSLIKKKLNKLNGIINFLKKDYSNLFRSHTHNFTGIYFATQILSLYTTYLQLHILNFTIFILYLNSINLSKPSLFSNILNTLVCTL